MGKIDASKYPFPPLMANDPTMPHFPDWIGNSFRFGRETGGNLA